MRSRRTGRTRAVLSPALGLLLLSVLWAVASLRTEMLPSLGTDSLPHAPRQAVLFCVFAAVAASVATARRCEYRAGAARGPVPASVSVSLWLRPRWWLPHRAGFPRWSALPSELLGLLVIELPALFLLFWLMRRLAATRMAARFFLAPLFAILAGMALEPTSPPVRAWLGMALLADGAGWLVFAPAEKNEVRNWNR